MSKRVPRLMPIAALLAVGALLVSGCSEQQEAPKRTPVPSENAASRTLGPALTVPELKAVAFKEGEVPQARSTPLSVPEPEGSGRTFPPASDPNCQTIIEVGNGVEAPSRIRQGFNWKESAFPGSSHLASYQGEAAEQQFAKLEQALASCRAYTREGYSGKISATVEVETAPQVGDEAVSFRELIPTASDSASDSATNEAQYVIVRVGNTIVMFTTMEVGTRASFPDEVIRQQVKRLQAAQRT
ncbi:hypothetical protein ACIBI4_30160 [Streptomyces sp. NPDC050418]|uniref:hypothetical protein n=1 Tax=Streptomyces sp. NPDC050418 TaxID=3365612 RepID=UPI0037B49DF9